jgi:hypothetical protein
MVSQEFDTSIVTVGSQVMKLNLFSYIFCVCNEVNKVLYCLNAKLLRLNFGLKTICNILWKLKPFYKAVTFKYLEECFRLTKVFLVSFV